MKTLGRRMTKPARRFRVAHHKYNQKRHASQQTQLKVDFSVEIDLEVGREDPCRPTWKRSKSPVPVGVTTSSTRDYRPPSYKPSWDPEGLCVGCCEKVGLQYMPSLFKNGEGVLELWHYQCLQKMLNPPASKKPDPLKD